MPRRVGPWVFPWDPGSVPTLVLPHQNLSFPAPVIADPHFPSLSGGNFPLHLLHPLHTLLVISEAARLGS